MHISFCNKLFLCRVPVGETVVDSSDTVKENEAVVKVSDADRSGFV